MTPVAICSPENAKRGDDAFNGDGSQDLGNRFSNDIVRFLEAAGATERGMQREYCQEQERAHTSRKISLYLPVSSTSNNEES